jgi:hypothetical protein
MGRISSTSWWFIRDEIGQWLRERYQVPAELPPKLLALVRRLDDRDWLFPSVADKTTEIYWEVEMSGSKATVWLIEML